MHLEWRMLRTMHRGEGLTSRAKIAPYLFAVLCVAASTGVAFVVSIYASSLEEEATIYLFGVVLASLIFDRKVSILTALGSILCCEYLFIPPRMTLASNDGRKVLTFLAMMLVAAVISGLSDRLRQQEKVARRAARASKALYELNVELMGGRDAQHLASITARHLERLFECPAMVLLRSADGALGSSLLPPEAMARAQRAWIRGELTTETSATGFVLWVPILGIRESLGVVGLDLEHGFVAGSHEALLFSGCARELATAIDRAHLAESAQRAKLDAETERMRSSLLSAVSHDIKTPLSSIVAAGTTLIEHRKALESSAIDRLLGTIVREGDRLGRLVQNLLSLSRLESPTIELRRTPEAVEDIVGAALGHLSEALAPRKVRVELPTDLPYVSAEPMLVEQVLLNLLENALRYTPPESAIEVAVQAGDGVVKIRVSDEGPGISEAEREKVFEKFYRGARTHKNDGGVGLGLTICRAIVEAHGGRIVVRARQGGGTVVEFTLPLAPAPAPWLPASAEEMIG